MRRFVAGACFLFALWFFVQMLGLLFIERIAEQAPGDVRHVPISVRFVGFVADRLQENTLGIQLKPDGSNWPLGFQLFFILELCGLAGLSLGLAQLGAGVLKGRAKWKFEARQIIGCSVGALLVGVLALQLIQTRVHQEAITRSVASDSPASP